MQLLRILADGRFHSGEQLGAQLGISRSAIGKRLQQLEQTLGLELHAVRGKGYRLREPLSLLDSGLIAAEFPHLHLHLEDAVDSTNSLAMRLCREHPQQSQLVLAEMQTAGRGRRGRAWASPYGLNLYLSRTLPINAPLQQLQAPSLVVGLAVVRTLRSLGITDCGLKWPNDILVNGHKVAGILLELTGDPADSCHVIIGVGLNVNMQQHDGIDQAWTSLRQQLGRRLERNELLVALLRHLEDMLQLHRLQGFPAFHAEWEASHLWQGRLVTLSGVGTSVHGRVMGVTTDGSLRLDVNGQEQIFSGGELSLRLQHDS